MRTLTSLIPFLVWTLAAAVAAEPEKSVIQIRNFSQQPDWTAPWRFSAVQQFGGSGFVIAGKRIMTNAHVVSWGSEIYVRRYQDPTQYLARLRFVAYDCDLAILEVEDETFFNGLEPLSFGELPKVLSTVATYGYPSGGEQISSTRGVVSRIELSQYVVGGIRSFLAVQTDAAINPGNSGGPVIQDGVVIGVAFQGIPGLENAGFFIPPPVIRHFLKDIDDGKYDGFPQAGIRLVPLQNPAYRRYLQLPEIGLGAKVDSILPIPSTQAVLKEEDVLMKIGQFDVGSDATILYGGNRVAAAAAFQDAQHGESVPIKIWRDGKPLDLAVPVYFYAGDRPRGNLYEVPKYFVYGGLVFTPLSMNYLSSAGATGADEGSAEMIYELNYRQQEAPDKARTEPIVLSAVLPHQVNANFGTRGRSLVDKINGIRIEKLTDVIRAFEQNKEEYHTIEFSPSHTLEALKREDADRAKNEILQSNRIPSDRQL